MNVKLLFIASLLSLALTGCVSFNPAGPLSPPAETATYTQPYGAMLGDIKVTDETINEAQRRNIADQLAPQIEDYIKRGEFFQHSLTFPAKLDKQDVQLQFNFSSLKARRTPHPAYIPGALITLTMWIWFNGPIYVDKYDLAAEVIILDKEGKALASAEKVVKQNKNTGLWDYDYMFPNGTAQLTELIDSLLNASTSKLPR